MTSKLEAIFQKAAKAFSIKRCQLGKADLDKEQLAEVSEWSYKQLLGLGADRMGNPVAAMSIDVEK